jgi:hypothetical protein
MAMDAPIFDVYWSDLLGGGLVGTVLLLALIERLRRTFATKVDLNGLGDRVNLLQTHNAQLQEAIDDTRERLMSVETEQKLQWERVMEQVIRPLERITEKLEGMGTAQAAQAAALEQIGKWLDRMEGTRKGPQTPRRNG